MFWIQIRSDPELFGLKSRILLIITQKMKIYKEM